MAENAKRKISSSDNQPTNETEPGLGIEKTNDMSIIPFRRKVLFLLFFWEFLFFTFLLFFFKVFYCKKIGN